MTVIRHTCGFINHYCFHSRGKIKPLWKSWCLVRYGTTINALRWINECKETLGNLLLSPGCPEYSWWVLGSCPLWLLQTLWSRLAAYWHRTSYAYRCHLGHAGCQQVYPGCLWSVFFFLCHRKKPSLVFLSLEKLALLWHCLWSVVSSLESVASRRVCRHNVENMTMHSMSCKGISTWKLKFHLFSVSVTFFFPSYSC